MFSAHYVKKPWHGCGIALCLLMLAACRRETHPPSDGEVVVYCSVDQHIAESILREFQERTGVEVRTTFDSEAGKTTGLVNKIIGEAQAGRTRADVFWSSELFNTIRLARQGLLEPYSSAAAADIPTRYKDPQHRWAAYAVRGRVLAFDPRAVDGAAMPTRWEELAEPGIAKQTAIANPMFGTTRGHVAAMFASWGAKRGRAFLSGLRDGGALIVDGNSAAVRAVVDGRARFAATDTDDVWAAQRAGESVDLRYLDMGDGGTLWIPCSVAMLRGAPHPGAARRLIDFLISQEVEAKLAQSRARHVSVREARQAESEPAAPAASKTDYEGIADALDQAASAVREILLR